MLKLLKYQIGDMIYATVAAISIKMMVILNTLVCIVKSTFCCTTIITANGAAIATVLCVIGAVVAGISAGAATVRDGKKFDS